MAKVPFRERLTNSSGVLTRIWHRFFNDLENEMDTVENQPSADVSELYSIDKTTTIQSRLDFLDKKIAFLLGMQQNNNLQRQIDTLYKKFETITIKNNTENEKRISLLEKKIELLENSKNYDKDIDLLNKKLYI
jgi:hypothetical protein